MKKKPQNYLKKNDGLLSLPLALGEKKNWERGEILKKNILSCAPKLKVPQKLIRIIFIIFLVVYYYFFNLKKVHTSTVADRFVTINFRLRTLRQSSSRLTQMSRFHSMCPGFFFLWPGNLFFFYLSDEKFLFSVQKGLS